MARFIYLYKSFQIFLALITIFSLVLVDKLCRTKVELLKNHQPVLAAPLSSHIFETTPSDSFTETYVLADNDTQQLINATRNGPIAANESLEKPTGKLVDKAKTRDTGIASKESLIDFVPDARTIVYTSHCVPSGFFDVLSGNTPVGTHFIYTHMLAKRFIPVMTLICFAIYCIGRMLSLAARPYSATRFVGGPFRCSDYVHCFFSLLILGGGFATLLYTHYRWHDVGYWPHVDSMMDFPGSWVAAEFFFITLLLIVCAEIGLCDHLYAIIKLDTTYFGYDLPSHQNDPNTSRVPLSRSSTHRIPRNNVICVSDPVHPHFDHVDDNPLNDISNFHRNFWGSFNSNFERNFGQRASMLGRRARSRPVPLPMPNFDASDIQPRMNTPNLNESVA